MFLGLGGQLESSELLFNIGYYLRIYFTDTRL